MYRVSVGDQAGVSDEELGLAYRSARLVIVPLRYGAGVKGKVVEALAWGTPVVTTSIGAEGIPGIEEAAAIADGPDAFATAVLRLISDDAAWRAQRAASLALVERVFSVERARAIIRADFTAPIIPRVT